MILKRGDIVKFPSLTEEPTLTNTATVLRVAKDGSWVDIQSMFGRKRVTTTHLQKVTHITVYANAYVV